MTFENCNTDRSKVREAFEAKVIDGLPMENPNAAGIDIGSTEHYVAVPSHFPNPVRTFGCYTPDLLSMASWLKECKINSVVMESTGVYWVPVYKVLTDSGLQVELVDARHAKNVPGRKTDVWDCQWLCKLHMYGLLRGCFLPPSDVIALRTYFRHRSSLVEAATQQVLRMQKCLEQMNLQLHKVISDITGLSGMKMLRAIIAGERDPKILAEMRHYSVKATEEEIISALTGYYRDEQLFALEQAVDAFDFIHSQMEKCDIKIEQVLGELSGSGAPTPPGTNGKLKSRNRSKNQMNFDARSEMTRIFGVDLTQIEGIETHTVMTLLSECGPDLSRFASEKHFASWLALCPNHQITGGKVRRNRTRRGKNRLATALCLAAQSMHRSQSVMGAYFRRQKAKLGTPKAITATAHRMARLIYILVTRGEEYYSQGQTNYEQKYKERQLANLKKQALNQGFTLVETVSGVAVS